MNKKFLLLMLIGLVFAHADRLDSLRNRPALLQPKLFFASTDNWIPPTLPSDYCVLGGCCLFPIAGFSVYKISKADTIHKDTTIEKKYRWSIGFGYSGGVCYTGDDLVRAMAPGEEFSVDFTRWLYWSNAVTGTITYELNKKLNIEIGLRYIWSVLEQREPNIQEETPPTENPWVHYGERWSITTIAPCFSIAKYTNNKNLQKIFKITLETYFTKGLDIERASKYDTLSYYITKYDTVENWGNGIGLCLATGINKKLIASLFWYTLIGIKLGTSKEMGNNINSPLIWRHPIDVIFNGAVIEIGIKFGR